MTSKCPCFGGKYGDLQVEMVCRVVDHKYDLLIKEQKLKLS